MVTLRQLRFLIALAEELNFSRAAEICHVTQPTLSAGLKELEDRLGVLLVERTKRSVIMTPIGAEIAERARRMLRDADEIEALAEAQRDPLAGDLRLGAIPTIGPFLIPRALPRIRESFPDLRLYLREEITDSLVAGLAEGRLDVVLLAQPFDLGEMETAELFEDGYHLATPSGGSVLNKAAVHGEDLEGARLLLLEKGHCLQRHALSAFPERDIQQDESFSATSLGTLVSMVSEGLGVTLLPDLAIDAGAAGGQDIDIAPLEGACPRHVVLGWRPTSPRKALFAELAAIFRETRRTMRTRAIHVAKRDEECEQV